MSAKITRTSGLAARHVDLGATFGEYIRVSAPMAYDMPMIDQHNAVREKAGIFDLTPFLKFWVRGKDAKAVLNHVMVVDVTKMKVGQAKYSPVLKEDGLICDDGIALMLAEDEFLFVHGDGCARAMSELSAEGKDCEVEYEGALHLISVQGPLSRDLLSPMIKDDLASLKYFQCMRSEINGVPCILARCGYSGELGYEVYVGPEHVVQTWDKIVEAGKPMGAIPCSLGTKFHLRLEAGLVWRRFDLMEFTPWEAGLGWAVNPNKEADYRGKAPCLASEGKERGLLCGLDINLDKALAGGEKLYIDGKEVGSVNGAPSYTDRMKKSLAWSRIVPEHTAVGTVVEVRNADGVVCTATVADFPLYDHEKTRVRM